MRTSSKRNVLAGLVLSAVLLGGSVAAAAPAAAAIPGWSSWPVVSWEACQYWKGQYAKAGYLTTACTFQSPGYTFQYHR